MCFLINGLNNKINALNNIRSYNYYNFKVMVNLNNIMR